jgi:hypothetical protein
MPGTGERSWPMSLYQRPASAHSGAHALSEQRGHKVLVYLYL